MLWMMYEFNRNKKNPFEQNLAHFKVFWIQKLTLWARDTISFDKYCRVAFPAGFVLINIVDWVLYLWILCNDRTSTTKLYQEL